MTHGHLTSSYRYCLSQEGQNYHIDDRGSRNVMCGCMPSIRLNGVYAWLGKQKGSRKHLANKRNKWVGYRHNLWKYNHPDTHKFPPLKELA